MTTANDIISAAFRRIGVSPTTTQTANALISLNNMISLWGADFMVPSVTLESSTLTTATAEYTVGPSKDIDTTRPSKLVGCYLRDSDGYDHPVEVLSREDYNKVYDKDVSGLPEGVYFEPTETYITLYFDRVPDEAYTAYLTFWKNFTEFTATSATFSQPNEYKKPMIENLAVNLDEVFDRDVPQTLWLQAEDSYMKLKKLNSTTRLVPKSKFDLAGTGWNITTDSY